MYRLIDLHGRKCDYKSGDLNNRQGAKNIFRDDMNFLPFLPKDLGVWFTQLKAQFILT